MEAVRESWTDERMDDLSHRVDEGFRQVDQRFDHVEGDIRALRIEMRTEFAAARGEMTDEFAAVRGEMKDEFSAMRTEHQALRSEITERFDHTQFLMIRIGGAMLATLAAAFFGLIATQF